MAIKAKMLGREALNRKLRQLAPEVEKAAEIIKLQIAKDVAGEITNRAPVGATHQYMASISGGYQRNNPGKTSLSSQPSKDPDATGIYANYIWRFLEFGTRPHINSGMFAGSQHPGTAPQPHIFPTWRAMKPKAKKKLNAAINKAVRKAMGK